MFGSLKNPFEEISQIIRRGKESEMSEREFLEKEIESWRFSPARKMMITGQLYYEGEHDILKRKRTVIGEGGELEEIDNLPNNRVVDNQYGKLVNQKADYLLGKPFAIRGDNPNYIRLLKGIFNRSFMKLLKNAGKGALNWGIAWLYPYFDSENGVSFKLIPGYELLPFWSDSNHTRLDKAVRVYKVCGYEGTKPVITEKAEVYTPKGVERFFLEKGKLIPDVEAEGRISYLSECEKGEEEKLSFGKIPLIPIKYNESEIPLIKRVKSLQDGVNALLSDFENNMQEDPRNTILILKNYDGTNLGEFRKNLALYGAVKIRSDSEAQGGVEPLEVKVNADNYKAILDIFKQAIIENGMGYNSMGPRLGGSAFSTPNELNIKSMYTDIDLDANEMEMELQGAFEELMYFIDGYFSFMGAGDFEKEEVEFIFNRDMLVNESEVIDNCIKSIGLLSEETVVAQHPWVDTPLKEMERRTAEKFKTEKQND